MVAWNEASTHAIGEIVSLPDYRLQFLLPAFQPFTSVPHSTYSTSGIQLRFLRARRDTRKVVPDVHARYFGGFLSDRTLTPGENPRIGAIRFEDWLGQSTPQAGASRDPINFRER